MQRVIVSMPDELVEAIDAAARSEQRSRSFMIRHAAEQLYLADTGPESTTGGHEFAPQTRNALRCDHCGKRRVDHK